MVRPNFVVNLEGKEIKPPYNYIPICYIPRCNWGQCPYEDGYQLVYGNPCTPEVVAGRNGHETFTFPPDFQSMIRDEGKTCVYTYYKDFPIGGRPDCSPNGGRTNGLIIRKGSNVFISETKKHKTALASDRGKGDQEEMLMYAYVDSKMEPQMNVNFKLESLDFNYNTIRPLYEGIYTPKWMDTVVEKWFDKAIPYFTGKLLKKIPHGKIWCRDWCFVKDCEYKLREQNGK